MKASKKLLFRLNEFQTVQRDSGQTIINFMDVHDFAPLRVFLSFFMESECCLVKLCHVFMTKLSRPTKLTPLKQVKPCSQIIMFFFGRWQGITP